MFRSHEDIFEVCKATVAAIDPQGLGLTSPPRKPPQRHAHNPFVDGMLIDAKPTREALTRERLHAGKDEPVALEVNEVRYVDREQFTRVFRTALRAAFDLPPAGARVFFLVLAMLRPGTEQINLNWRADGWKIEGVDHTLTLPRTTLWRGTIALVRAGFLADTTEPGCYWVNPRRIYSGSRIRLATEYRVGKRGPGGPFGPKIQVKYPKSHDPAAPAA